MRDLHYGLGINTQNPYISFFATGTRADFHPVYQVRRIGNRFKFYCDVPKVHMTDGIEVIKGAVKL